MKKINFWNILRKRWTYRYRLVIIDDQTFHEKFSVRLTIANVVTLGSLISLLLVILTTFVIAFTPLREYIPGYGDIKEKSEVVQLVRKTDSLQKVLDLQEKYTMKLVQFLSRNDSTFIENMKNAWSETHSIQENVTIPSTSNTSKGESFLISPLPHAIMVNGFDISKGHFGIDLGANEGDPVLAVADGIVIFADWTLEGGNTILILHPNDMISVYMHNSVLLKSKGDVVMRGEPIAKVGNTGIATTGYHLHFELWKNDIPVNPLFYIAL
jgi:murein DD-endopeptidase MepM/ murein hydrolase activator NlpD